jgi:hypothetical protein
MTPFEESFRKIALPAMLLASLSFSLTEAAAARAATAPPTPVMPGGAGVPTPPPTPVMPGGGRRGGHGGGRSQAHMKRAQRALRSALSALQAATPDKDGYLQKAIDAVEQAQTDVTQGIKAGAH